MGATLGIGRDDAAVILFALEHGKRFGQPPTAETVRGFEPRFAEDDLEALFGQDWFRALAEERGVPLDAGTGLSARQVAALAIYMDTSVRANHSQRLKLAGVPAQLWQAWLLDSRFAAELGTLAEDRLRAAQPLALQRLMEAVDKGERWAIEMSLEMSGRHDRRTGMTNLPALFQQIIRILDEEVTPLPGGADVVLRIATQLQTVAEAAVAPPKAIGRSAA